MVVLVDSMINQAHLEHMLLGGLALGITLLVAHTMFRKTAKPGTRWAKVLVELQRKSFHMIGGCLIGGAVHLGVKRGVLSPAYNPTGAGDDTAAMNAGIALLACCFVSWVVEASRLMIPPIQKWYLESFKGLVREKEFNKAAGIAYFLPGTLAAALAGPTNFAVLGVLFLSVGDAAASIGTAAGFIPVGSSSRKVEGSIGCFVVCSGLALYAGLVPNIAITASFIATVGEVLAEVIGLDDNFVIPLLCVMGIRFAVQPQWFAVFAVMGSTFGVAVLLGAVVSSTTRTKQDGKKEKK